MARTAVAHFRNRRDADAAFENLVDRGFSRDDISIMGRGVEGKPGLADDGERDHVSAGEGAAAGGIVGLLLGAAAMLIPGIGPIVAVGPITAALAGAVTGGVTGTVVGGIAGALIHSGVPEHEARYYEDRVREGGVLVSVRTDDAQYDDAVTILERHGGDVRAAGPRAATTTATERRDDVSSRAGEGAQRVELRDEQLIPHKEDRAAGEVRISKQVEEVPRQVETEAYREEVRLRHVPVNQVVNDRVAPWDEDGVLVVPVYEEQVVTVKQLVLKEHLRIERVRITEKRTFEDTVQRERLVVDHDNHPELVREEWPSPQERPQVSEPHPTAGGRPGAS
jgi:uncharacterized protein (TIGR02271 family)